METGLIQNFDDKVSGFLSVLDKNKYISAAVTIFLIVYASMAAPKLPEYMAVLFDNVWFKLLILFLIAYSAQKNPTIAIIAAIGLMVTLQVLNRYKFNQMLSDFIKSREHMEAKVSEASKRLDADVEMQMNYIPNEEGSVSIGTEEIADIQHEQHMPDGSDNKQKSCTVTANFRNSFYPQYVDLKPDSYMARDNESSVSGFDDSSNLAPA